MIYIDDYAHHPEEIKAFLQTIKTIYPLKKATGIFQPHLFSRTRDFAEEFAQALSLLDEIILLDIYPAREVPIEGITSSFLLDLIPTKNKKLVSKAAFLPLQVKQTELRAAKNLATPTNGIVVTREIEFPLAEIVFPNGLRLVINQAINADLLSQLMQAAG